MRNYPIKESKIEALRELFSPANQCIFSAHNHSETVFTSYVWVRSKQQS